MKKTALIFVLLITFLSCEKNLNNVPDNEIPGWLKARISQDEQIITDSPKFWYSYGAWLRYKWENDYYFEYHNILSETTVAPVSYNGDTLYYGATNMKYYKEKCCVQYVWKGPRYKEF